MRVRGCIGGVAVAGKVRDYMRGWADGFRVYAWLFFVVLLGPAAESGVLQYDCQQRQHDAGLLHRLRRPFGPERVPDEHIRVSDFDGGYICEQLRICVDVLSDGGEFGGRPHALGCVLLEEFAVILTEVIFIFYCIWR